jgi:hypothetical protein
MKGFLIGLMALPLLGGSLLLGQAPTVVPYGQDGMNGQDPVLVVGADGASCVGTHTTCVREHYLKEKKEVIYKTGCEPLCLPRCGCLFGHRNCDSGQCVQRHCDRRYLMKKTVTCEEPATRCVPAAVPGCPAVPMASGEQIGMPTLK